MPRRFWKMRNRVLVVGYHPAMIGGVTVITGLLLEHIGYLDLHVALRCYRPRWKALAYFAFSVASFLLRLVFAAPRVVQVLIGSRGDMVRALPFLFLGKVRGCKLCLHFHTNVTLLTGELHPFVRRLLVRAWQMADCYCFLTRSQQDEFARRFALAKRHVTIPNALADRWLDGPVPCPDERPRDLIFLGRWCPEKGSRELLSAMQSLAVGRAVQCDIFSDYLPKQPVANCAFFGWLAENEVREALRKSKVLLLPTHGEAFGLVLAEAAACGTPFVSTKIGGVAEDSQAGLVHVLGDIEGMKNAIARLLTDKELWRECSCNGRRWAESLQISRIVPLWHRLYAELGVNNEDPPVARGGAV
jgi:glycosyltransferase involved in cell wall biosynthesis